MIEGLNFISNLLRLYRLRERLYLRVADKPTHPDFVQAVVESYFNVFEYQPRLIFHLSRSLLQRVIRGTLELDGREGRDGKSRKLQRQLYEYAICYNIRQDERKRILRQVLVRGLVWCSWHRIWLFCIYRWFQTSCIHKVLYRKIDSAIMRISRGFYIVPACIYADMRPYIRTAEFIPIICSI